MSVLPAKRAFLSPGSLARSKIIGNCGIIKPDVAQPFYVDYFRRLENQGADTKVEAKPYLVNGKMTGGFAYVAYPAKYDDTGV